MIYVSTNLNLLEIFIGKKKKNSTLKFYVIALLLKTYLLYLREFLIMQTFIPLVSGILA